MRPLTTTADESGVTILINDPTSGVDWLLVFPADDPYGTHFRRRWYSAGDWTDTDAEPHPDTEAKLLALVVGKHPLPAGWRWSQACGTWGVTQEVARRVAA